jgi:putative aldouronate transport system permease protein
MVVRSKTLGARSFDVFNYIFLAALALTCMLPMIHILAVSFSESSAAAANQVKFLPVGFHTVAYEQVLKSKGFWSAFLVSTARVVAGASLNMLLIFLLAYPLSKEPEEFKGRNVFMWLLFFPMLFNGGLIPTFLLVRNLRLINSFWSLILPGAVPIFSVIILMNFFRRLPKSLYEAALIDGAGHFTVLFKIYLPLSMASIATLTLFSMVGHWNEWFSGLIYMNNSTRWPLQTFLRQLLVNVDYSRITKDDLANLEKLSDRSFKAAQIFIATFPILCVYPFLQKHFVKGIVLGSVKE